MLGAQMDPSDSNVISMPPFRDDPRQRLGVRHLRPWFLGCQFFLFIKNNFFFCSRDFIQQKKIHLLTSLKHRVCVCGGWGGGVEKYNKKKKSHRTYLRSFEVD